VLGNKQIHVIDISDITEYCKTSFFCVPFISWIWRASQVHKNNGHENLNAVAFQCSRKQKC